jgi:hypothetical protein
LAFILLCAALISGALFCGPRNFKENNPSVTETIPQQLPISPGEKLSYEVTFNGLKAGTIDFEYLSRKDNLDLVVVTTKVNVLNIFRIDSKDSVYIDAATCLPQRVERDVVFFGKPEHIIEEYNQKDGWVNVIQEKGGKIKNRIIPQVPPIHNSHSLFFIYPLALENKIGAQLDFNLPLEKVKIKVKELRKGQTSQGEREFYVCEVSPKRIVLELDKEKRVPLKLEMPALWSKLVITRLPLAKASQNSLR